MHQLANKYFGHCLCRQGEGRDSVPSLGRMSRHGSRHNTRCSSYVAGLLLLTFIAQSTPAQEKSAVPLRGLTPAIIVVPGTPQQTLDPPAKRSITLADAVSIFLRQ